MRSLGVRTLCLVADIRDPGVMIQAAERTLAELGGLDIVVANAGIYPACDTLELFEAETAATVLNVNVLGTVHTVRAALPGLRQRTGDG